MKRILFIALLSFLAYGASAQAGSLTVVNSSNCTVYYIIRGDKPGTCNTSVTSSFITLAPGATINYPNSTTIPGFPTTTILWITMANIYPRPLSCGAPDIFSVGEPCTGFPLTISYPVYKPTCILCNPSENATWVPASSPGGLATLKFY